MPASPGEALLGTLFGDVHYYFSAPNTRPRHHRFDRGSYVYLFQNAAENRAKLEIANHAGTPDQDAFSGNLDIATITYSYKQPSLFTIAIDGSTLQDHDQWHLPSYNERNEQKYLYKIQSMDIYFWTESDASTFMKHLRTVISSSRLDIRDAPISPSTPVEHQDSMSPVVQQLEQTAITPQFTPQRQESNASKQSQHPSASPAPMAYNPAAPAAPEKIAHREKTPPPPEADQGNGLNTRSIYSNVPNTFGGPPTQATHHQAYFPGPPQQQQRTPSITSFPGPPGSTPPSRNSSQQYVPTFAGPPGHVQSPQPSQNFGARPPSFGAPMQHATTYPQHSQQTPSFGPNAIASPGLSGPGQGPPSYQQHNSNPHNYSHYDYNAAQAAQSYGQYGAYTGDIHGHACRPTAEEMTHGHGAQQPRKQSDARARVEARVANVESKVGKYLKKLDRMI